MNFTTKNDDDVVDDFHELMNSK